MSVTTKSTRQDGTTGEPAARPALGQAATITRRAGLLLPLALAGCSFFDTMFSEDKKLTPGKRENVLAPERSLSPLDTVGDPVLLPPATSNPDWVQTGGTPSHLVGNVAFGGLNRQWRASIGAGSGYRRKLTAQPVVVGDRVWTMDSKATVTASDMRTGARLWRVDTRSEDDAGATATGGGIAWADGRLYVVTGRADALALDAATGKTLWRVSTGSPAMSPPTIGGGVLYFGTIDQKMRALDLAHGHQIWEYQATSTAEAVLDQPAPALGEGVLVAGFGSGDIAGLDVKSGATVWSDNLGSVRSSSGLAEFTSIVAAPVIQSGTAYAIGLGGLFVAFDVRSGRRLWENEASGSRTPAVAGDWIFAVTQDQKLVCFRTLDGRPRWIADLPRFVNVEKQKNAIYWAGPLLAGGKLYLASDHGQMFTVDPRNGKQIGELKLDAPVSIAPIAAGGQLLLLSDDGSLTAYR